MQPLFPTDRADVTLSSREDTERAKSADRRVRPGANVGRVIRRRVIVHGMVQGVFFRDTCRREAVTRGVSGWVRNRSDGAVEAVFEGPDEDVEAMCSWCRRGPRYAAVESVDIAAEEPVGSSGFEVRA
jgi:acylphosphatase